MPSSKKKWDNMKFMVNYTTHEDIMNRFTNTVYCYTHHKDNIESKWVALVYLNKDDECEGWEHSFTNLLKIMLMVRITTLKKI